MNKKRLHDFSCNLIKLILNFNTKNKFRLNVDLKKEPRNMHFKPTVEFQHHKISATGSISASNQQDNHTFEARQNQDSELNRNRN